MNRCLLPRFFSSRSPLARGMASLLLVSAALAVQPTATAQIVPRNFPANALRATLVVTQPPVITLNGNAERLSPGARIRGSNNLLVLSGSLVGQELLVNYVREPVGLIQEVWILTEAEAKEKRRGAEPVTNYVAGSDADKPKVDDGKTPFNQLPTYGK